MTLLLVPATVPTPYAGPAPTRATPYLELDVPAAVARYHRLAAALPGTGLHYAVKANPSPHCSRRWPAPGVASTWRARPR